jgi:hypothetical protein
MNHVKWLVVSLTLVLEMATSSFAQDPGWPRQRVENGNTLVLYQPQVDDWREFQDLHWRMALSVTPAGGKAAIGLGILRGQTAVDNDNRMVLITNIQIVETRFPGLDQDRTSRLDQLTSSGGRAAGASTAYGTTAAGKTASGDMYAGHDGNVYKNTGSGWQKYDNGSWNSVQKPAPASGAAPTRSSQATAAPSNQQRAEGAETGRFASHEGGGSEQTQRLQQEAQNRQRGEQSSQRFQQYQRSAGGASGRFHAGGGGRRR